MFPPHFLYIRYTTKTDLEMNYLSPKIVFQLQVLIVCGASMVVSNPNVTTCSCYAFYEQKATGTESETNCSENGGHLVTMETLKEWELIKSEIQNRSTDEWYIGLKNISNAWRWINNNTSQTIEKWQPNEPSGDGICAIMAKKYPYSRRGLWNDLPCNNRKSFICEYDQGNYKCNSSKIVHCEHKTKPTKRAVTTTVCTISDPDPDRFNLLYVVIALGILLAGGIVFYIYIFYCKNRNSGFSNGCQEYKTFKFKNRTSLGLEEGATPLQIEPSTETVVEDDSNKTDREMEMEMENSAGLENPAQDALTEDSLNKDYTSPVDPSSTSTYASLYSSVEVEQKKPEESEDVKPPKVPSPHHEVSREPVVYAMIDKSKKTNKKNSQIEVVYATVNKKRRDTKDNS